MKKIFDTTIVFIILLFANSKLLSQVSIALPTCVMPVTVYQYTIIGNWDSTSAMSVCIRGGAIYDFVDSNECTPKGPPVANAVVDWDTSGTWLLSLTSSSGNATLNVSVISPLKVGIIDVTSKMRMIGNDSMPATIICTAASGGSCSPFYSSKWQQSSDLLRWYDMPGATDQNLTIDSALTPSAYYRRKVIENTSGSVAYSDVASVFVGISGFKYNLNTDKLYCLFNSILSLNKQEIGISIPYPYQPCLTENLLKLS